jgi:hypothetical protein
VGSDGGSGWFLFFGAVAYSGFVKVGKYECALSFPNPLDESPWYLCRQLIG